MTRVGQKSFTSLRTIILIFLILLIQFLLDSVFQKTDTDLHFTIRGSRTISDNFLFVFIGQNDVSDLGGWPITRDYYGYATHILQSSGASVIAFDILFQKSDVRYQEYDDQLAEFFRTSGNVCLPMTFAQLQKISKLQTGSGQLREGLQPLFPLKEIAEQAAAVGFSNLGTAPTVYRIPLIVHSGDSLQFSFGAEMARLFLDKNARLKMDGNRLLIQSSGKTKREIPLDSEGFLNLNHFGTFSEVRSMSFVDLLQMFDDPQDSLNFKDRIVLVGVTIPGVGQIKSTPLSAALPASLLHLTAAENIIGENYIRYIPPAGQIFITLILLLIVLSVHQLSAKKYLLVIDLVVLILYGFLSAMLFRFQNIATPLIVTAAAVVLMASYLQLQAYYRERRDQVSHQKMLLNQITRKESDLENSKLKLRELQTKLASADSESGEIQKLADERRETIRKLEKELRDLNAYSAEPAGRDRSEIAGIIHSPAGKMAEILDTIQRISSDDIPVLITGETGTGKELVARAIHNSGHRADKDFIAVNCGALTETLLESELFGHEKGSFTGAHARRRGRFELADGGTIFLDEITETSPAFQARLLRVLQEGKFERVGGEQSLQINIRVIAATNRDIQEEIGKGKFREDLFYRLNGFPLKLPPLRERSEDIPLLASHFLEIYDYAPVRKFSDEAMKSLQDYYWPGNVRELQNAVRRAALLAQSENRELIRLNDLPPEILKTGAPEMSGNIYPALETQILEMLRSMEFSRSAISRTAEALGNRDRGTITEYFRGICFEKLIEQNFNISAAARSIAGDTSPQAIERVKKKIKEYLNNLAPLPSIDPENETELNSYPQFKGLPKKYHPGLIRIIARLQSSGIPDL